MVLFHKLFPSPDAVLLDQFNTIIFFTHYHGLDVASRPARTPAALYRHEVSKNGWCLPGAGADNSIWNFDFTESLTFHRSISTGALPQRRRDRLRCFASNSAHLDQPHTLQEKEEFQKKVQTLSAQAGLRTKRLVVEGRDIFCRVRERRRRHSITVD